MFQDINEDELTVLAGNYLVVSSQTERDHIKGRYINLVNPKHWPELLNVAESPIQLITKINDKYMLIESSCATEAVLKHKRGRAEILNRYASEDTLLEKFLGSDSPDFQKAASVIYVCDMPGMGKSWLLENLARKVQESDPSRCVFFIDISLFCEVIVDQDQNQSNLLQILGFVCKSELMSSLLLLMYYKYNLHFYFFFDSFDQVPRQDLQKTVAFINAMRELQNVNICVASRPHMKRMLEHNLKVLSFSLLAFRRTQQVSTLVCRWMLENPGSESLLFTEFANDCIEACEKLQDQCTSVVLGIPLQCQILAAIHSSHAKTIARRRRCIKLDLTVKYASLFDLYEQYVQEMFVRKQTDTLTTSEQRKAIFNFHCQYAFDVIFYKRRGMTCITPNIDIDMDIVYRMGILVAGNPMRFVHRTFAEYFVAKYLVNHTAKPYSWNQENFIVNELLRLNEEVFEHRTILWFFEKSLEKSMKELSESDKLSEQIMWPEYTRLSEPCQLCVPCQLCEAGQLGESGYLCNAAQVGQVGQLRVLWQIRPPLLLDITLLCIKEDFPNLLRFLISRVPTKRSRLLREITLGKPKYGKQYGWCNCCSERQRNIGALLFWIANRASIHTAHQIFVCLEPNGAILFAKYSHRRSFCRNHIIIPATKRADQSYEMLLLLTRKLPGIRNNVIEWALCQRHTEKIRSILSGILDADRSGLLMLKLQHETSFPFNPTSCLFVSSKYDFEWCDIDRRTRLRWLDRSESERFVWGLRFLAFTTNTQKQSSWVQMKCWLLDILQYVLVLFKTPVGFIYLLYLLLFVLLPIELYHYWYNAGQYPEPHLRVGFIRQYSDNLTNGCIGASYQPNISLSRCTCSFEPFSVSFELMLRVFQIFVYFSLFVLEVLEPLVKHMVITITQCTVKVVHDK